MKINVVTFCVTICNHNNNNNKCYIKFIIITAFIYCTIKYNIKM